MSRYLTISLSATGEHVSTTDRPYHDGRIVNLDIGPLTLMLSGKTEEDTERTLVALHDALTTLLAASRARRVAELGLHPGVTLVGGNVPEHVAGAYPRLSCCGGPVHLVDDIDDDGGPGITADDYHDLGLCPDCEADLTAGETHAQDCPLFLKFGAVA